MRRNCLTCSRVTRLIRRILGEELYIYIYIYMSDVNSSSFYVYCQLFPWMKKSFSIPNREEIVCVSLRNGQVINALLLLMCLSCYLCVCVS